MIETMFHNGKSFALSLFIILEENILHNNEIGLLLNNQNDWEMLFIYTKTFCKEDVDASYRFMVFVFHERSFNQVFRNWLSCRAWNIKSTV